MSGESAACLSKFLVLHGPVLIGLAATVMLGLFVGCLVRSVGDYVKFPEAPVPRLQEEWRQLKEMNTGGRHIGRLETLIFFASFWANGYFVALVPAWLVMKTAFYWNSANFAQFPAEIPATSEEMRYVVAKRHLGSHHVATALTGTAGNIVAALIGVTIGRWLQYP